MLSITTQRIHTKALCIYIEAGSAVIDSLTPRTTLGMQPCHINFNDVSDA